jgi:molybdate transport system substrate-binding protein
MAAGGLVRKIVYGIFMMIMVTAAGTAQRREQILTVFAASSLSEVFSEIGKQYERLHPGVHVVCNFGGSQVLLQELLHGAEADIFAPANGRSMETAVEAGIIDTTTVRTLCANSLVVIMPAKNPGKIDSLQALARDGVSIIVAQKEVPAGSYALDMLSKCDREFRGDFKERVVRNIVSYEENVKVVVGKIRLGEADAGIVYRSDVATDSHHTLSVIGIPPRLNMTAFYPIGVLTGKRGNPAAIQFIDFCSGDGAKKIFTRFGFTADASSKESR